MPFRLLWIPLLRCATGLSIVWISTFAAPVAMSTPASPTGSTPTGKLVFSSTRDGNSEIYKVNADGSELTRLTTNDDDRDVEPKWSPDGTKILFTRTIFKIQLDSIASGSPKLVSSTKLFIMNADGSGQKRLTSDSPGTASATEANASWSPDGRKILFLRTSSEQPQSFRLFPFSMYTVNLDGSGEQEIGPNDLVTVGIDKIRAIFNGPQWSPDGESIVFEIGTEMWIINADGSAYTTSGSTQAPTAFPIDGAAARFAPDGSEIAFASNRNGDFELFVMSGSGSDQRPLTKNQITDFDPTWSPDGSIILFTRDSTNDMEDLWILDRDTSKERKVVEQVDSLAKKIFVGNGWIAVERWTSDDRRDLDDRQDIEMIAIDGSTSYILAGASARDSLGSWHPDAISADGTGDATESTPLPVWPLVAIGITGACIGAWYWNRGKRSGTASPAS